MNPISSILRLSRLSSLLAVAFASPLVAVQAQETTTPAAPDTTRALGTVVVTASQREQAIKEAPASISVITREDLDAKPYATLQDVLRNVEGVAVVGDSPNTQDISIRGMPGSYTLILVDGKRQSTRETMNRGTEGVQASLIPPLNAIERIEIVRGPMSSLYGADALGGVVNIITRKVPKVWGGSVTVGGVWQKEANQGDSQNLSFWVAGPVKDDVVGLQFAGKTQRREEDDIYFPLNATSGANGRKDQGLSARLTIKPAANQDIAIEVGGERLSYAATPGLSNADTVAATAIVRTQHDRTHWGVTHDGRWDFGTSTVSLYHETGRQTQWTPTGQSAVEPVIGNTTLEGRVVLPWDNNILTVGAQGIWARLKGVARQDVAPGGYGLNADQIDRDAWAVFAENDFMLNDRFTLTTGLRLDNDERYGKHWSPRLYGVYKIDANWTARGGVATGFKVPTIRQNTPGYCMTTGGQAGAVAGTLCGNDNLKPETSLTEELGIRYDQGQSFASATLFSSKFKNKVASYDTGRPDPRSPGRNIYVYDNIDRVELSGVEFGAGSQLSRAWRVSGSFTVTNSRRQGGGEPAFNGSSLEGRPLDKTPKHKLTAQVDWSPLPQLNAYTAVNHIGKEYWAAFRNGAQGVRERMGSTTLDLGLSYAISPSLKLNATLLNLTNKIVPVDTRSRTGGLNGNWLVDEGRRLAVNLTGTF